MVVSYQKLPASAAFDFRRDFYQKRSVSTSEGKRGQSRQNGLHEGKSYNTCTNIESKQANIRQDSSPLKVYEFGQRALTTALDNKKKLSTAIDVENNKKLKQENFQDSELLSEVRRIERLITEQSEKVDQLQKNKKFLSSLSK